MEKMKKERPRNSTSTPKKFELIALLAKVCKKVDGHAVYDEGWNDKAVSDEVGLHIDAVKYFRTQGIGPVRKFGKDSIHARVERLEHLLEEMSQKLRPLM